MTRLSLRPTTRDDLDFVMRAQDAEGNFAFIHARSPEEHQADASNMDKSHLIVQDENGQALGYVVLTGLTQRSGNIEFRTIVIAERGRGYERQAVRLVMNLAFTILGAYRLFLDVSEDNTRARRLYQSEGFVEEGVAREAFCAPSGRKSFVVMSMLKREFSVRV